MWINELGDLYLEQGGYGVGVAYRPGPVHGLKGTVDDKNSKGYKGIFGAGGSPPGLYNQAIADGMRLPLGEQEEDQMISKNHVLHLLHKHIDECNDSTTKFNLLQIIKQL